MLFCKKKLLWTGKTEEPGALAPFFMLLETAFQIISDARVELP